MFPLISHHILLCANSKKALCCNPSIGIESWQTLKKVIKELRLEDPERKNGIVLRSKVDCLRVCTDGPILLIWPEGIWYRKVIPEKIYSIINSHIIHGKPIEEYILKVSTFKCFSTKYSY